MKTTPKELRQIIKEELEAVMEDGHTDVPSAIRKLKTSMEDAMQILSALEQMPETELPSWWMSKVTLAADYLNKSRDYLLVSEKLDPSDGAGSYVKDFRKSDAPQFKGKGKKKGKGGGKGKGKKKK